MLIITGVLVVKHGHVVTLQEIVHVYLILSDIGIGGVIFGFHNLMFVAILTVQSTRAIVNSDKQNTREILQ